MDIKVMTVENVTPLSASRCIQLSGNNGKDIKVMTVENVTPLSASRCIQLSGNNSMAIQVKTVENVTITLDSSSINDGRSLLAMFLTVLYEVEGLETEALKQDIVQ